MPTIYPVIMSGGSGTRLWPLSRGSKPKQFQSLVTEKTMLEETVHRIGPSTDAYTVAPPTIICGASHGELVSDILSDQGFHDASIILEPVGRNTAAVAVVASLHVAAQDPEGIVLLLPADHHVTAPDSFQAAIGHALPLALDHLIITFGIKAIRPDTGFGYIRFGETLSDHGCVVEAFVEKPDAETAQTYLDQGGYAWNAGIFMYSAQTMLEEALKHAGDIARSTEAAFNEGSFVSDHVLQLDPDLFEGVRSESIDYAVMEHTDKAAVVGPVEMGWSDVGSWSSVSELTPADADPCSNTIILECENTFIRSDGPLIAAVGLKDIIIIGTEDAILALPADRAQDVKKIVSELKERKRMDLL